MRMQCYFYGDCPVKIWGLTPRERVERVVAHLGPLRLLEDLEEVDAEGTVLVLRGDCLYDDRLVHYLAATSNVAITLASRDGGERVVAAHVAAPLAGKALEVVAGNASPQSLEEDQVQVQRLEDVPISYRRKTRKAETAFVLPVTLENGRALEDRLFEWSYKGVTDLVTKWVWPVPARWAVRQCVRLGLRPNHVTLIGFLLVILAGVLFAQGRFGWGLLAGWFMTFLDTVDGKLARVTVTSSRFGHYFDHIIDLVHPPIWYLLWGVGLNGMWPVGLGVSMEAALWAIVVGYVAGRLAEGLFQWFFGSFGIFCWRPTDSFFRLVTARRNPNLLILTASLLAGRPDVGLLGVAFWTVATSLFLAARLALAAYTRWRRGPLTSWLEADRADFSTNRIAVRWFARHAT